MTDNAREIVCPIQSPSYQRSYTEVVLLHRISSIGVAVGLPCGSMAELARRVEETGKEVDDLTIGELLELIAEMPRVHVQC